MKNKITLLTIVLLLSQSINAQIIKATPQELKLLEKRILIIPVRDTLSGAKREKAMERQIKANQKIRAFNKYVKRHFNTTNWEHNDSITFMSANKIMQLRAKSKYLVLTYTNSANGSEEASKNVTIPTWNMLKGEQVDRRGLMEGHFTGTAKVPYTFFLPHGFTKYGKAWTEGQIIMAIRMMNYHLGEVKKNSSKKKLTYLRYLKNLNCSKPSTIHLNRTLYHKNTSTADAKSAYKGKIVAQNNEDFNDMIVSDEDNYALVMMPYGIGVGNAGFVTQTVVQFAKVIVNTQTGEVVFAFGFNYGETFDYYYRKAFFKKAAKCN